MNDELKSIVFVRNEIHQVVKIIKGGRRRSWMRRFFSIRNGENKSAIFSGYQPFEKIKPHYHEFF